MESLWLAFSGAVNRLFVSRKNLVQGYGVSALLILSASLVKSTLHLFWGDVISFHLYTLVVILSAWYGGLGPGIFATFISGIASLVLFAPDGSQFTKAENFYSTSLFIVEGLMISTISEALRQAERQKDDFLGFASHELKNPLTVAKGYAGLIRLKSQKEGDKKLQEYSVAIETHLAKTSELVADLLDLTRLETGNFVYHDQVFNINELVSNVVHDQSVISPVHKIRLSGKSTKQMAGDPYRVGQILINLITNAIKYSPDANRVDVIVKDNPTGTLIQVRDFGLGISKDEQSRVFQRFYRVRPNSKIRGLGVGLYISSLIAKRHNAELQVKSRLGRGSSFFLQLPSRKKTSSILSQTVLY